MENKELYHNMLIFWEGSVYTDEVFEVKLSYLYYLINYIYILSNKDTSLGFLYFLLVNQQSRIKKNILQWM